MNSSTICEDAKQELWSGSCMFSWIRPRVFLFSTFQCDIQQWPACPPLSNATATPFRLNWPFVQPRLLGVCTCQHSPKWKQQRHQKSASHLPSTYPGKKGTARAPGKDNHAHRDVGLTFHHVEDQGRLGKPNNCEHHRRAEFGHSDRR